MGENYIESEKAEEKPRELRRRSKLINKFTTRLTHWVK